MARNKKFDAPVTDAPAGEVQAVAPTEQAEAAAPAPAAKPERKPRTGITLTLGSAPDKPLACHPYAMPVKAQRFEVFINGDVTLVCNTQFQRKDGPLSQYGYFPLGPSSFYVKDFQFVEGEHYHVTVPEGFEFRTPQSREAEYEKIKARKAATKADAETPESLPAVAEAGADTPVSAEV